MTQYYLFDDNNKYLCTSLLAEQPINGTDIYPTVNIDFAVWDGTQWIDPRTEAEKKKANVPSSITRRQLKLQLLFSGISFEYIEGILNTLEEPQKTIALINWQEAGTFDRDNAMLNQMAIVLGISDDQLDDIFINGSVL